MDIKKTMWDFGTGAVAGVGDQLISKWDVNRAVSAGGQKLKWYKRAGTYYNYGVPLAVLGLSMMRMIRGDMETRLMTIGGQLAAREITEAFQDRKLTAAPYRPMGMPAPQITYLPTPNPQPISTAPHVPIVQPQANFGGRGLS